MKIVTVLIGISHQDELTINHKTNISLNKNKFKFQLCIEIFKLSFINS